MDEVLARSVKETVTQDFRTAAIFEKYAIDFCCQGGKSLQAACAEKGVDTAAVLAELGTVGTAGGAKDVRFAEWDLDALVDFVVNNHHRYIRRTAPVLLAHTEKIAAVHGRNHPELLPIAGRFRAVASELMSHMMKEEHILFPYITSLAEASRTGTQMVHPPFGSIRNPIRMMEAEHQSAGDGLHFIREVSRSFALPPDACTTYTITYRELDEFELDLHQHVHIENNIMFPNAIALEERLLR